MPVIGLHKQNFLPSIWAETRAPMTPYDERLNVPQMVTRSETEALSNNTIGPAHRITPQAPETIWRNADRPGTAIDQSPDPQRSNQSPLTQSQSDYQPHNYLAYNYNLAGQATYAPQYNPVVINKII